jgi:hypothetical protein
LLLGTLTTIGGSCGTPSSVKPAADARRSSRFRFEGYLPHALPSGYSLIGQRPWLVPLVDQGQVVVIGASHPDGSTDRITTVEEWLWPTSKKDSWWLGYYLHRPSSERPTCGNPGRVRNETKEGTLPNLALARYSGV